MTSRFAAPRQLRLVLAVLLTSMLGLARAEDAPQPPEQQPATAPSGKKTAGPATRENARDGAPNASAAAEQHRLPLDSTTKHTLALPGRTLAFTATAGSIRLFDGKGEPQADIAYTAYTLDDADPHTRPVAFVVNGGPGASSAWLQLGGLGPWRLALDGPPTPSTSPLPVANADTWLDFTDLVFIDPPGSGFSRLAGTSDETRRRFWSVEGDIPHIAEVIRRWTVQQGRAASPHLVVGESYGGFRAPRLALSLQTGEGLGVSGLVLVSPVLDFDWLPRGTDPMALVGRLPSMAAVAA